MLLARSRVDSAWLRAVTNLHVCGQPHSAVVTRAETEMVTALAWAFSTVPEAVVLALEETARLYRCCRLCGLRWLFAAEEPSAPMWFSAAFGRAFAQENPDTPASFASLIEHVVWGCLASQGIRTRDDALRRVGIEAKAYQA